VRLCHLHQIAGGGHPQRVFAFLSSSIRSKHENIALAILDPKVDPVDYPQVAEVILDFFTNSLRLRGVSIHRSGMGAVYVSFASALDRQTVLGVPHGMEPYWLSFVLHDAGPNLCHLPIDRTCWLMLVNFPLDGLNERCIASAVSSFVKLVHGHRSSSLA
jgi:hypothetical protein